MMMTMKVRNADCDWRSYYKLLHCMTVRDGDSTTDKPNKGCFDYSYF